MCVFPAKKHVSLFIQLVVRFFVENRAAFEQLKYAEAVVVSKQGQAGTIFGSAWVENMVYPLVN